MTMVGSPVRRLVEITGEECGECGDEEREDDGWTGLSLGDLSGQHVQTSAQSTSDTCSPHHTARSD